MPPPPTAELPCWIVSPFSVAVTPLLPAKILTPPLGVPPGSQPVQPPSTTIVAPVAWIVLFAASVSVPLVRVMVQFSPAVNVTAPPPAIAARSDPAPLSAQLLTVPAAPAGRGGSSQKQATTAMPASATANRRTILAILFPPLDVVT